MAETKTQTAKSQSTFVKRFSSLDLELAKWKPALKDLSTYIDQTRGLFDDAEPNQGKMINHKVILDEHGTHARNILSSGLQEGMTSKSRPWFKLTLSDPMLMEEPGAREWLDYIQNRMYMILDKSNMYSIFSSAYEELGQFGTACFIVLTDYDDVIRGYSFTAGEYRIGVDEKGRVNTFARKFWLTADQVVGAFGYDNCSAKVKNNYDNNQLDQKVLILNLIEPNTDRIGGLEDFMNMPYRSVYWESGNTSPEFLAKRGFKKFPVVAPRWKTTTTNQTLGYGPGWFALGNIKQLQKTVKDKLIAQEKIHNPPVQSDASVSGHPNLLPGGVTKTTATTPNTGVRPAYQIDVRLDSFENSINNLKAAIDRSFYVNIFLMIINSQDRDKTATEIAELQQEKMLMLGPILHNLDSEMLSPFLELLYFAMADAGLIPPAPDSLQGAEIRVQYVSILAQAMKAAGITEIQSVFAITNELMPQSVDVLDSDEAVREISDMQGIPAKIVKDKNKLNAEREQKLKVAQMAQTAEIANVGAEATKKLSEAKMDQGSALDNIMQGVKK